MIPRGKSNRHCTLGCLAGRQQKIIGSALIPQLRNGLKSTSWVSHMRLMQLCLAVQNCCLLLSLQPSDFLSYYGQEKGALTCQFLHQFLLWAPAGVWVISCSSLLL